MTFNQLNGKKVLLRLFLNLSISSIVALTMYAILVKHNDTGDSVYIMLRLVYGFGLSFFLIYYFAGRREFRVSRRLLDDVLALKIFDNSNYCFKGYLEDEVRIAYTQECLCGYIDDFPVIIFFYLATSKGERSQLIFEFLTTKFKHTHIERLSIRLNWLNGYEPVSDIKSEVHSFVASLKSKQVVTGSFDEMIAAKKLAKV